MGYLNNRGVMAMCSRVEVRREGVGWVWWPGYCEEGMESMGYLSISNL